MEYFVDLIIEYIDDIRDIFNINEKHIVELSDTLSDIKGNYHNKIIIRPSKYLSKYLLSQKDQFINNLTQLFSFNKLKLVDITVDFENDQIIINVTYQTNNYKLTTISELPEEILNDEILLNSKYEDIKRFCMISSKYKKICYSNLFWRKKFIHDYGFVPSLDNKNIEQDYKYYGTVWVLGRDSYKITNMINENPGLPLELPGKYIKSINVFDGIMLLDLNNHIYTIGEINYTSENRDYMYYMRTRNTNIYTEKMFSNYPLKKPVFNENGIELKVKDIISRHHTILIIDENDELWYIGSFSIYISQDKFTKIPLVDEYNNKLYVKDISIGKGFIAFIDTNNNLWGLGNNHNGQFGNGTTNNINILERLNYFPKVIKVKCCKSFICVIDVNNNIWGSGKIKASRYDHFMLGDFIEYSNVIINTKVPVQLFPNIYRFKDISCGDNHILLIDMNDNAWNFGDNSSGQLGRGNTNYTNKLEVVYILNKIKYISCISNMSSIIDIDGKLWTFGDNSYGNLDITDYKIPKIPFRLGILDDYEIPYPNKNKYFSNNKIKISSVSSIYGYITVLYNKVD